MDDREIKQWDQRLLDQVNRAWDNYKHLHIDLSVARIDQPYLMAGEYLYVEDSSGADAKAKIKLNRTTNDELDLEQGVKIETVFIEVFVSNDALEDEWIDLVFGINFKYKKKITIDEIIGVLNFLVGGPIITPAGIDLTINPGGSLIVDSPAYFNDLASFFSGVSFMGYAGAFLLHFYSTEIITIPIGQGAAGFVSALNLAPQDSTIIGFVCRVIQQPGGGATIFDIGRTGAGNLDEFIDGVGTALGNTGTFAANHDAITTGPIFNDIARTLTVTTDVNVLVAPMVIRVMLFYRQETPFTA